MKSIEGPWICRFAEAPSSSRIASAVGEVGVALLYLPDSPSPAGAWVDFFYTPGEVPPPDVNSMGESKRWLRTGAGDADCFDGGFAIAGRKGAYRFEFT